MVESTQAEAEKRGVTNMRFERVDAEDLAYPDNAFDAAMCVLGLMYPADPQKAIDQIHRILKPGGRAAVAVWGRRDRCGWAEIFPITDARVESDVCPMFFQLGLPNALKLALDHAGFAESTEFRIDKPLNFAGEREVLAAMFAGGPVALAYSKFSPEVKDAVHSEFLASVASYRNGAGFDIPGEFVFMLGRKAG